MPKDMKHLALLLFQIGAFKTRLQSPDGKGFLLKLHEKNPDAPRSPFFLNLRTPDNPKPGPLEPYIVRQIGYCLQELAVSLELNFTLVAGLPRAGDPLAEAFLQSSNRQPRPGLIKLRKEELASKRSITSVVEGSFGRDETVLLIDDVVTEAHTKLEAIKVLRGYELRVNNILVVVDREQGGAAQLEKANCRVHSLFTIRDLLAFYRRTMIPGDSGSKPCLEQHLYEEILAYLDATKS